MERRPLFCHEQQNDKCKQHFLCLIRASFWLLMYLETNIKKATGIIPVDRFTEFLSCHPHLFCGSLISFAGQQTSWWPYMAAVRGTALDPLSFAWQIWINYILLGLLSPPPDLTAPENLFSTLPLRWPSILCLCVFFCVCTPFWKHPTTATTFDNCSFLKWRAVFWALSSHFNIWFWDQKKMTKYFALIYII